MRNFLKSIFYNSLSFTNIESCTVVFAQIFIYKFSSIMIASFLFAWKLILHYKFTLGMFINDVRYLRGQRVQLWCSWNTSVWSHYVYHLTEKCGVPKNPNIEFTSFLNDPITEKYFTIGISLQKRWKKFILNFWFAHFTFHLNEF